MLVLFPCKYFRITMPTEPVLNPLICKPLLNQSLLSMSFFCFILLPLFYLSFLFIIEKWLTCIIILVSGIQHQDSTFVYTAKWPPQISLLNIHQHMSLQIFFPVMRPFRIYSLSNFQIYNTILLTIVTLLYIPVTYWFYNWKFVLFNYLCPFCLFLPPTSDKYQTILCYVWLHFFLFV